MKRWAIIHGPSGAIIAISSRRAFEPTPDMIVEEAGLDIAADTHWWDGAGFAVREDAQISLPTAFAADGGVLVLQKSDGAWHIGSDGSLSQATQVTASSSYKVNRFTLVGRYRGFVSLTVVPDDSAAAAVESALLAAVKERAEQLKAQALTPGYAKAQEYVQKGKEAAASATLLAATLNALTASAAAAQYPMAQAERLITGETLSAVLARYRAGKASSDAELARLSAIEWKAVQAIKSAATVAAKQAAYTAINWSQS